MAAERSPRESLHLDQPPGERDLEVLTEQLGRPVRAVRAIGHRCGCGNPDVVVTEPRLPDGTPFPTLFYLTCPRVTGAVSTLESAGLMRALAEELQEDPDLAAAYQRAHEDYLAARLLLGEVPEIALTSAGGMPNRVKCLHVLVAHALAAGPGANPLGDRALAALAERGLTGQGAWGGSDSCVPGAGQSGWAGA